MKIRFGFVSNSSSSSFVVAFEKRPQSMEEVSAFLFYEGQTDFPHPYNDKTWPCENIAKAVFEQIEEQKKSLTIEEIYGIFRFGWMEGMPKIPNWSKDPEEDERRQLTWRKELDSFAELKAGQFMRMNEGKEFYKFHFSDDAEFGSLCEHGEIFDKLPHERVSQH